MLVSICLSVVVRHGSSFFGSLTTTRTAHFYFAAQILLFLSNTRPRDLLSVNTSKPMIPARAVPSVLASKAFNTRRSSRPRWILLRDGAEPRRLCLLVSSPARLSRFEPHVVAWLLSSLPALFGALRMKAMAEQGMK
jgi:hypothetical protein